MFCDRLWASLVHLVPAMWSGLARLVNITANAPSPRSSLFLESLLCHSHSRYKILPSILPLMLSSNSNGWEVSVASDSQ
jgi:hypothetical protein